MPPPGTLGDARICVAILDGPVDLRHACFAGASIKRIASLATQRPGRGVATCHGTHVASVLFGQPGTVVEGLAPGCRGLVIPVFADAPTGLTCSQLDLARAILLAVENGAHVINLSGGQLSPSGMATPILEQAIERCRVQNVLIVAAAGNDGCDCLHVPAAAASVLAVGAMDGDGAPLPSSNWGHLYASNGVLAPGAEIPGARLEGGVSRFSGTSFATPIVTAMAALLLSAQLRAGLPPDPHAVRARLLAMAAPCLPDDIADCRRVLGGRLPFRLPQTRSPLMSDLETSLLSDQTAGDPPLPFSPAATSIERGVAPSGLAASAAPQARAPRTPAGLAPSGCGCGGAGGDAPAESDCGCGCGGHDGPPTLVYALGTIGIDFGTEARRDSFTQAMDDGTNPGDMVALLAHIAQNPFEAPSLIWTLNLDATPIYAIEPAGAYAALGYERLRDFLHGQIGQGVEMVSVPGVIAGKVRLQSGQVVPVIAPSIRGMYSWASSALVKATMGPEPSSETGIADYERRSAGLTDFLSRIYYDLRNLGITAEERALNYSATNAFQVADVIRATTIGDLDLDTITVKPSPVCRPDSACYDVELAFYNPDNTNVASRIYRFTVDVSDVNPVTIGAVRNWTRRG
ncbi:S8 family serine peptidase [Beijerinckia sp. L45]|uniref:cyanobactin maturation protease PatG family protein n=1 Tax=Beijerinckia sp. L45 TaxID=1641855 RepID=UPI0015758616|nr:S8 family serine peptidase [Beijerinckia sp. L45]